MNGYILSKQRVIKYFIEIGLSLHLKAEIDPFSEEIVNPEQMDAIFSLAYPKIGLFKGK